MRTRSEINDLFDLTDRVAIVTGGSRGIGRAIAETFAACGARVVIASRKADACTTAAQAITDAGGTALAAPTHCGRIDELEALVATTVDTFGGVDIVVNNAANALAQPFGAMTTEAWDSSYGVNLKGPMFLVQHALPHLVASGHGAIVNVISAGAFTHGTYMSMYCSAKAAMLQVTRAMSSELISHGIRANALAPGTTDTDMVRNNPPESQRSMIDAAPIKRIATPEEIANGALFLASDAASFMTGQCLLIDGGMTTP